MFMFWFDCIWLLWFADFVCLSCFDCLFLFCLFAGWFANSVVCYSPGCVIL